jgi:hypothetical protein
MAITGGFIAGRIHTLQRGVCRVLVMKGSHESRRNGAISRSRSSELSLGHPAACRREAELAFRRDPAFGQSFPVARSAKSQMCSFEVAGLDGSGHLTNRRIPLAFVGLCFLLDG